MKKVEKKNLLTALYCRLSVDDFDEKDKKKNKEELESNSITHQKQILEDYCKRNGIRNYRFFLMTVSAVRPLTDRAFRKWRR